MCIQQSVNDQEHEENIQINGNKTGESHYRIRLLTAFRLLPLSSLVMIEAEGSS